MADFFIADTHFGHGNIIKYCRRPFLNDTEKQMQKWADEGLVRQDEFKISRESIDLMNSTIIDNINAVVGQDDTLWHGGDFGWGPSFDEFKKWRDRIVCRNINLIWGNHDPGLHSKDKFSIATLFSKVFHQILIKVEGQAIFLNHYPMRSWDRAHHGSWHLYGHVHGLYFEQDAKSLDLTLDIGVDTHDFKPWSMDELRAVIVPKLAGWKERRDAHNRKAPQSTLKTDAERAKDVEVGFCQKE
jgi:calcineurin-like phosphoesterase family protein